MAGPFDGIDVSDLPSVGDALRDNFKAVVQYNPQRVADTIRAAKVNGSVPYSNANPEVAGLEAKYAEASRHLDQIASDHPLAAKFLSDPQNMALVHDDLPNVAQHAAAVKEVQQAHSLIDHFGAGLETSVPGIFATKGMPGLEPSPDATLPQRLAYQAGSLAGDLPVMGVGSFLGTLAGGPIAGGAAAFGLPAAIREAMLEHYHDREMDPQKIILQALKQGVVGAVTTVTGGLARAGLAAKALPGAVKAAAPIAAEVAAMTGAGKAVEGEQPKATDFLEAAILVGALHGAGKIGEIGAKAVSEQLHAQQNIRFYEAMGDTAKAAKLRERLPEAHQALIKTLTGGTSVKDIYVPVQKWDAYFQGANVNPGKMADDLGVTNAYHEALATGGDVKVPLDVWTSKLVNTPHYRGLVNDVRFNQEELTVNERNDLAAEVDKRLSAAEKESTFAQGFERLKSEYRDQLVKAGQDEGLADKNAHVVARMVAVSALRNGVPIEQAGRPRIFGSEAEAQAYTQHLQDADREQAAAFDMDIKAKAGGISPVLDRVIAGGGFNSEDFKKNWGGELQDIKMPGLFTKRGKTVAGHAEEIAASNEIPGFEYDEHKMLDRIRDEWAAVKEFKRTHGEKTYATMRSRLEQEPAKPGQARASYDPLSRAIVLGKTADASSFIHELAHDWVEQLFHSVRGEAGPEVNNEFAGSLRKWFSGQAPTVMEEIRREIKSLKANNERTAAQDQRLAALEPVIPEIYKRGGETYIASMVDKNLEGSDPIEREINRQFHEMFARGFERYMQEGKAPVGELQRLYSSFRKWLTKLYGAVTNLRAPITDDVRRVMDRMLATEEQIKTAEQGAGIDAEANESSTKAHEDAVAALNTRQMGEVAAKRMGEIELYRAKADDEARNDLKTQPLYRVMVDIGMESHAKGEGREAKMYDYARKQAQRFIDGKMGEQEEAFFEFAAVEKHGFSSGDEMAKAMLAAPDYMDIINQSVRAKMEAKYPSLKDNPTSMMDEAVRLTHNEDNLQGIAKQRDMFDADKMPAADAKRAPSRYREEAAAARTTAKRILAGKPVEDADKYLPYFTAEKNAAMRAQKAQDAGDMGAYRKARDQQMLNHALTLESYRIKARAIPLIRGLQKELTAKPDAFKTAEHFVQAVDLLSRFGLTRGDARYWDGKRKETLGEWAKRMSANTDTVDIPDWLQNETTRMDYRKLTLDQLQDLKDAVDNIRTVANFENRAYVICDKADLREVVAGMVERQQHSQDELARKSRAAGLSMVEPWQKKVLGAWDSVFWNSWLIRPESQLRLLDGFEFNGPWQKALFEKYNEGMNERGKMMMEAADRYKVIFGDYSAKELAELRSKKVHVPELNGSLTKAEIMVMALNRGSEGNLRVMAEGRNLQPEHVEDITNRHLDKRDWDTVNKVWRWVEEYRPRIGALYSDLTGFEPRWVEAQKVQTPHGVYPGGYYPLKADPRLNTRAMESAQEDKALNDAPTATWRAYTKNGFTKERNRAAAYPVSLDIDNIQRHVTDVINDLSLRKFVLDAQRVLNNKDVQDSMRADIGVPGLQKMRQWIRDVAGQNGFQANAGINGIMNEMRKRSVIAGLGYRVSALISQAHSVTSIIAADPEHFGWKNSAMGIMGFYSNVLRKPSTFSEMGKFVEENSPYMRERATELDRDLQDASRRLWGKDDPIGRFSMGMFHKLDQLITKPLWIEALKVGTELYEGDQAKAAAYADDLIRRSQVGGRHGEIAPFMRGDAGEVGKLLTMFYSFMNTSYNLWAERAVQTQGVRDIPAFLSTAAALMVVPGTVRNLSKIGLPTDEKKQKEWIKEYLAYPFHMFPVVREVADMGLDHILGLPDRGYSMTPIEDIVKTGGEVLGTMTSGKATGQRKLEATSRLASYAVPYPDQFNAWFFNLVDYVHNGMTPQESDIMRRRPAKER